MKKQWLKFSEEYLVCWNPSEAARRAGYSERSIHLQAHRLMQNEGIQNYLQVRIDELVMEANEAMIHLSKIARAPQAAFLTPNGFDLAGLLEAGHADVIKDIKWDTDGGYTIKFYDRLDALRTILQVHEKIKTQPQVSINLDGFDEMLRKVYGEEDG